MKPGYYEHIPRHASTGEIWRMANPLFFPLAWVTVKFRRPGGRSYTLLPHVTRDSQCAHDEIPAALRDRMDPLVAVAAQDGFAILYWSQYRHGVNLDFENQIAAVDLIDDSGILLRIIAMQGHRLHGPNIMIDQRIIAATSYRRVPTGTSPIIHTTTQVGGYHRMPGVASKVVRTTDPAVVIRAHRESLRGWELRAARDEVISATDAYEMAQWEYLIGRGLWRYACATRAELSAIIGEKTPANESPRSDNPYAAPAAIATAPALLAVGADPRRAIQVRADLGTDLAEFTLTDGKLLISGAGEAEIADADAFSRAIDLMPRNSCGFRVRRTRKTFGIPLDFVRLMLADIDTGRLLTLEMRKRFLRAFWSPLGTMAAFAVLALTHMDERGQNEAIPLIATMWGVIIGLHILANAVACWRPRFGWYRIHVCISLAYAAALAATATTEGYFFLFIAAAPAVDFLYGWAFVNLYAKIIAADEERRNSPVIPANAQGPG